MKRSGGRQPSKPATPGPRRRSSPGRRAAGKDHSRQKIVAAAKRLFAQRGYDRTTVRDIATEAGVSTGALFVSFVGKAEVFREVVLVERAAAWRDIDAALARCLADPAATIDEVLLAMFEIAYRHRLQDLPFIQETMRAAWSAEMGESLREMLGEWSISALIGKALAAAAERGQITRDADIALLSRMLWTSALGMVPRAVFDGWSLARLTEQLRAENAAILAGARPSGRA